MLFLLAFLVYPSLRLLSLSVMQNGTGAFSLSAFARFFGPSVYRQVLQTTFSIALQTTAYCLGVRLSARVLAVGPVQAPAASRRAARAAGVLDQHAGQEFSRGWSCSDAMASLPTSCMHWAWPVATGCCSIAPR